jgi:predicted phosphodiesterase
MKTIREVGLTGLIGLISDTHGLLRPEALRALEGSDLIIHAGDVLHDISKLDLKPEAASMRMVVSGHSHKPSQQEREGVIYVNPGSAGPRRFKLSVTIARVDVTPSPWRVEFVDLAPKRDNDTE